MAALSAIRWLVLRSMLALLSTLIVVLPVPITPSLARADAFNVSADNESFNFSSQSASSDEGAVESAGANALKQRTSPVSASGAFSTSVSIDVPPGRSGMTPSLGLSYVSDAFRKDSPVGAGWSFGVPSMSRDTSEGFPPTKSLEGKLRYDNDTAVFVGPSGRLVRTTSSEGLATTAGSTLFVPEREHSPVRYEYLASEERWIEHQPSGVKRYYGKLGTRSARVVNELGTHEWLLLKERDADGNTIDFDYHHLTGPDGQFRLGAWEKAQAEPVLKSVHWGANEVANLAHRFRVETEVRAYPGQLDMLNGHTVLTSQVRRIKVYGPPALGAPGERLYWDYALELSQSVDTYRHLLRSVTRRGYNLTTGAEETAVSRRFSYSDNGNASLLKLKQGRSEGALSRTLDTASREAYSKELLPLSSNHPELFRGGFQVDVTYGPKGQRPTIDSAQIADLNKERPMDALSPEYRGAGYRFEDLDVDGDVDVLYHPVGLGTPAARWLQHKSYLRDNSGFTRIAPDRAGAAGTVRGLPGTLLVSALADVDGDTDPDAVAFPLWWTDPTSAVGSSHYDAHYFSDESPFNPERLLAADNGRKRELLAAILLGEHTTSPHGSPCKAEGAPITATNGVLLSLPAAAPNAEPPAIFTPIRPPTPVFGVPEVGTQDPDGNLPFGDPMLDIRFRISRVLGFCRFIPWQSSYGPSPVGRHDLTLQVAYNTSRGDTSTAPPATLTIRGWPDSARKMARWGMQAIGMGLNCSGKLRGVPRSSICETDLSDPDKVHEALKVLLDPNAADPEPRVIWDAAFIQGSDFQAPMADVNADGRADIVLLKSMRLFPGGSYTNFSPNVYLSTGTGFASGLHNSPGVAFDVTGLIPNIDWSAVDVRRAYASSTRPLLSSLRPGEETELAPETLDLLPSLQRSEVEGVLNAFHAHDARDEGAAATLQTAVTSAFDRGTAARYPAPKAPLRSIAKDILRSAGGGWFGRGLNVPVNALPAVEVDLTEALMPVNDRVYLSLPGLQESLVRMGRPDAALQLTTFAQGLNAVLGITDIAELLPREAADSSFTKSALDIFNDGRDTFCDRLDTDKTCDVVSAYPISINFNAFVFDANGDGLPDMVAAHRPSLRPGENAQVIRRGCANGHQLHLNRGYRWDDMAESHSDATLPGVGWSSVGTLWQESHLSSPRGEAFSLLNQREQPCDKEPFLELDGPGLGGGGHVGFSASAPAAFRGLPMSAASFSDLNADGLTDVVFAAVVHGGSDNLNDPKQLAQHIFLNTGRGFAYVSDYTEAAILDDDLRLSPTPAWRGLPSDFYMTQYVPSHGTTLGTQDRARLVDIDNDGLLDIVYRGECLSVLSSRSTCSTAMWRRNLRKVPDLLTRIDDGSGAWTEIDYVSANSDAGRAVVRRSLSTPPTGLMVASEIRSGAQPIANIPDSWNDVGGPSVQRITLAYDNYTREQNGRRALGFATVMATFAIGVGSAFADISASTYTYDITKSISGTSVAYPLRGSLRSSHSLDRTGSGPSSEQLTTYDYVVGGLGSAAARIRTGRVTTKTKDGALWMVSASESSNFDSLGYPQKMVSGRATELGAILPSGPETSTTTMSYKHRTGEWRLGREESVTTTGERVSATGGRTAGAVLSKTVTTYDTAGRVASHAVLQDVGSSCSANRAQSNTTTFPSYSSAGLPYVINDNGTAVTLTYDDLHLYAATRSTTVPRTPSSPNGPKLEEGASYDPRFGSVTETSDMNGHTTERAYDSRGRLLTVVGPDESLLEQHFYNDADGGPWTATTKTYTTSTSSFLTWSAFDGDGRVLASNQQVSASAAVRLARNQFDGLGRLVASYQSATLDVAPAYSLQNLLLEGTALATRTTYDGFDRVRTQTMPDTRMVRHAYGSVSVASTVFARKTTTNPRNLTSVRVFNTRGSLVAMERRNAGNAAELSYRYEYDGAGRMVAVIDSLGTRRVSFDEGGRLRSATLPYLSGTPRTHAYCYDARAKLVSATTPQGRKVLVNRDALGRVADLKVAFFRQNNGQPTTSATFTYDCSAAEGSLGKLCERADDAGSTYITYDLYGRPNRYETTLDEDIANTLPDNIPNWYGVQFHYGLAGQLDSTTVEGLGTGAHQVSYSHDPNARTNGITVTDGAALRPLVKAATYDAFGRLKSATLGNNVVSPWDVHLASGHLTAQRMIDGTRTFAELRYPLAEYDPNGNIGREQHFANGELASEKVHTYDALDQLATSTLSIGGTERKNERFAFSQGNLTSVVGAGRTDTYAYTDTATDKQNTHAVKTITGSAGSDYARTITYDTDGWVSRDVETRPASGGLPATTTDRTLAFDAGGCMREAVVREAPANEAERTTTTRNICGFDATRAYRETTFPDAHVERVYYLPDGSELRPDKNLFVMQLPVATSTTATLAWSLDTGAIVHEESGYIHTDLRGSVVARTPLNASNATVPSAKAEYGVWGDTLAYSGTATPRYQFTNEEPDPGTGYYYFGARPYDPTLRRWLAPDALMMRDLAAGAATVVDLNLYAYAGNNPVNRIDKSGFAANCAEGACAPSNTHAPEMIFDLADGAANGAVPHGVANSTFGHDITWNVGRVLGATAGLVSDLVGAAAAGAAGAAAVVYSGGTAAVAGVGAMAATATATVAVVAGVVKAHAGALSDAVNSLGGGSSGGAPTNADKAPKEVGISRSKSPEALKHLEETGQTGQELTVDRGGSADRRKANMEGVETRPGLDRDESPPAVFKESTGGSVRHIPAGDNRSAGAQLGNQLRDVADGEKVIIKGTD